jgi:hypothetical protein
MLRLARVLCRRSAVSSVIIGSFRVAAGRALPAPAAFGTWTKRLRTLAFAAIATAAFMGLAASEATAQKANQPLSWENFYTAVGVDYSSTQNSLRSKGVSDEKVNYSAASLEGVVDYTGVPLVDLSFGVNLQPIFQDAGGSSEKFKGLPTFDEVGSTNGYFNGSATLGADAKLLQWQNFIAGPVIQYNATRQDLNGTLGSDNGQLLYSTTQQLRVGGFASVALPNDILVGGSAYWGAYNWAQVSTETGHSSDGWGFNAEVAMPFPSRPDWRLILLGGYEDMCIPISTPFYQEEYSTSNYYVGLKVLWQGLIGGTGGAKPWSGFYLTNDGH